MCACLHMVQCCGKRGMHEDAVLMRACKRALSSVCSWSLPDPNAACCICWSIQGAYPAVCHWVPKGAVRCMLPAVNRHMSCATRWAVPHATHLQASASVLAVCTMRHAFARCASCQWTMHLYQCNRCMPHRRPGYPLPHLRTCHCLQCGSPLNT